MATLYMVRHGQAGPDDDYDRLSPTGEEQARRLGDYWAERGVTFDRAFTGPRQRQRATAEIVAEAYAARGRPWPRVQVLDDLDEMRADQVFARSVASPDPRVRALVERTAEAPHKLFPELVEAWVRGELDVPGVEPWADFCARVGRALDVMRQRNGARRVLAFTSGGTISAAVRHALGLDDLATIRLVWTVRNGAWSEFLFSSDRFSLAAFNAQPHLDDDLVTTR